MRSPRIVTLLLLSVFITLGTLEIHAQGPPVWVGTVSDDWTDGLNWTSGTPPGPTDLAVLAVISFNTPTLRAGQSGIYDTAVIGLPFGTIQPGFPGTGGIILDGGTLTGRFTAMGVGGIAAVFVNSGLWSLREGINMTGISSPQDVVLIINGGQVMAPGGISMAVQPGGIINLNGGILSTPYVAGSPESLFFFNGGTLQALSGGELLSGFGTGNVFVIADSVISTAFSSTIASSIGGSGGLTFVGGGQVVLTGNNTYSGNTTIQSGQLVVNGNLASPLVIVSSGALLSNNGFVGGSVNVDSNAILNNNGAIGGNVSAGSGVLLSNNGVVSGSVNVDSNAILNNNGAVGGNVSAGAGALLSNNGGVGGSISVGSNAILDNNGAVGGNVSAGIAAILNNHGFVGGSVNVDSNAILNNYGSVGGNVSVGSGALLSNNGFVGGNVSVGSAAMLNNNGFVGGNVSVGSEAIVSNNGVVGGDVSIGSGAVVSNSGFVGGNVTNDGILNSTGTIGGNVINSGADTMLSNNGFVGGGITNYGILNSTGTIGGNVTNYGILNGTGTIGGNLINSGVVLPGNSPGTLTINGNYTQTADGSLVIQIVDQNAFSSLLVGGTANLDGTLLVFNSGGFVPDPVADFVIISAADVNGTFAKTAFPDGSDYTVIYDNGLVILRLTNTEAIRRTERSLQAITTGVKEVLFNAANTQYGQLVEWLAAVRAGEVEEVSLLGLPREPMQQQMAKHEAIYEKNTKRTLACKTEVSPWSVFAAASGVFSNIRNPCHLPRFNAMTGFFGIGADCRVARTTHVGIFGGYQGIKAWYPNGSWLRANGGKFGVYGMSEWNGFYLNAFVGGGFNCFRFSRNVHLNNDNSWVTRGRPSGGEFDSLLGGGYELNLGNWRFGTNSSIQYTYLGISSFRETGAGNSNYNVRVGRQNPSSLVSTLGGNIYYLWRPAPNYLIVPTIGLAWQHEFLNYGQTIPGVFNNGAGPAFSFYTLSGARNFAFGTAGLSAHFGRQISAYAYYNPQFGGGQVVSHGVLVGLSYSF